MCRSFACLAALCLVAACDARGTAGRSSASGGNGASGGSGAAPAGSGVAAGAGATGGVGAVGATGSGGATAAETGGAPTTPTTATTDASLCGDLQLAATRVIPAGTTVTVCAGSTVTLAAAASLSVAGTLVVEGTQASPVRLLGAQASAGSWPGIVVQSGGTLTASFLEIHGAGLGVDVSAGSSFAIDHLLIDTTSQALNLAASGTLSHGVLHGLGPDQQGPAIVVDSAAPRIVDTLVDQGAYGEVDLIIVEGATSAPVFDHVEVSDSHCAFHADQGSGVTISNAFVHHNAYGIMAIDSTGTTISHSNFEDNSINVGSCDSTATGRLMGNYFQGPATDSSCFQIGVSSVVTTPYTSDVGPRP